ncbi:MAG: hypothetical protein QOD77_622 [Thermoplasmata archaeon]|jgi:hypothetical protein|nr:hypothetical protein [Thermoplasmata archaeon]
MAAKKASRKTAKKATRKTAKKALSKKQVAQRKYAGAMSGIRKRAATAKGGKGRVKKRAAATGLRRKLGLKSA